MNSDHYVEATGVSLAWGLALKNIVRGSGKMLEPLTVAITGSDADDVLCEDPSIRQQLDRLLKSKGDQSVETVANTIFPYSMWNRAKPRSLLFERYMTIFQRLERASPKNRHGMYFHRMITNGPKNKENQLDFALNAYAQRKSVRKSMMQVGIFDSRQDHSLAALRGFPCLQHLSFVPNHSSGSLSINAFYAKQYMVLKGYGNYLGLCRLGEFIAHELKLNLTRVTLHVGSAELRLNKGDVTPLLMSIDDALETHKGTT